MRTHVVVGAGAIGRGIAARLAAKGGRVVLASRSGVSTPPPGVAGARVDASDTDAIIDLAQGADTLVNALNPAKYYEWLRDWPPMAAAMLTAAEKTGAGLLTVSNLYGYGPVDGPMTEETPLATTVPKGRVRADMWLDALAAHEAGRVRATELRASDYFGADATGGTSILNTFVVKRAATGRPVRMMTGRTDVPHSWSYLPDIVELASVLADDDRSWGRAWHVPTSPPRSVEQVARDVAEIVGRPAPPVGLLAAPIRLAARVHPLVRELDHTRYQFDAPFVLDSSAAESTFGLSPTPWRTALERTIEGLHGGGSATA